MKKGTYRERVDRLFRLVNKDVHDRAVRELNKELDARLNKINVRYLWVLVLVLAILVLLSLLQ